MLGPSQPRLPSLDLERLLARAAPPDKVKLIEALHRAMPLQNGGNSPEEKDRAQVRQPFTSVPSRSLTFQTIVCLHNGETVTIKPLLWGCNTLLVAPEAEQVPDMISLRVLELNGD